MRLALIALAISMLACDRQAANETERASPKAESEKPAGATNSAASPAATAPSASSQGPARAGGLRFEMPAPFERRTPKSGMRAAEYGIQGAPRAELGVFYFGENQGGSVEANLTRWIGQFSQPDGSDTAARAKREELNVQGMAVTLVEVEGTYSGGMGMPGAGAPSPAQESMMLAAIASGPKGPVFFKLVGPKDAVESAKSSFRKGLESLRIDAAAQ
jgi:hypothetical protein